MRDLAAMSRGVRAAGGGISRRRSARDRSARVERPFHHIENNFYAGRTFADVADLNAQLRAWCEKVDATPKKRLGTTPLALFATEQTALRPLPLHVPEVYALHRRSVDAEGYVHVHTNRYSVPAALLDREIDVHETKDRVRVFDGHKLVCEHDREADGAGRRKTLPEHDAEGRWHRRAMRATPSTEERLLRADSPVMAQMVDVLQKRHGGRATRRLGRLHRLWLDYPSEPLRAALAVAVEHGLADLDRIEILVLRHIAGNFFRMPIIEDDEK